MKKTSLWVMAMLSLAACTSNDKNPPSKDAGNDATASSGGASSGGASSGGSSGTGATDGGPSSSGGAPGTGGSANPMWPVADAASYGIDGSASVVIDRSHLKNTGTTPFDYSDPALWLCRPGINPDECYSDLDATEILKDGTTKLDEHVRVKDPEYDCFYVYPTVDLTGDGNMTDLSNIDLTLDPLLSQGARFTRLCRVYAPLYRQVSLSIGAAPADGGGADGGSVGVTGDGMLAYGDVKAAFQYYMDHWNGGRKFVLMGHSQGTAMLTELVSEEFDGTDAASKALRAQLISALLIGGGISVPQGKDVGGTFKNLPLCTKPSQVGCVIAYNSFAKDAPPPANTLFGKAQAGMQNACTNPATLAGNTGNYLGGYTPYVFFDPVFKPDTPPLQPPAEPTPFVMLRDVFKGQCVNQNGLSYLEISVNQSADDTRPVYAYRNSGSEALGFGMHVIDYAIEMEDLLKAVDLQAKAALGRDM